MLVSSSHNGPFGERYSTILMFGQPGSGKGTQGKAVGDLPGFYHLSCGDVFRSLNPASELGKIFLEYSTQGKLVPDEFTVRLWSEHIRRAVQTNHFHPSEEILLLDGIPRNVHQAEMMKQYINVMLAVCLEAENEDELIQRMRRRALHENRLDDTNMEVIRQRFREYDAETRPILEYYPAELIRKVDAGRKPIEVLSSVIDAVKDISIPAER